ncbi:MAG: hypothetical protein RBT35_07325 [Bacteroidales bacterium]|jgi:hypothetical protein|nr:hypothetical protein [Bacteroidales bacterium]
MKRQITVFFLLILLSSPIEANSPNKVESVASNQIVQRDLATQQKKSENGPDWTYYIWISAAFVLVAVVGFAENLINEEREKVKKLRSQNHKQLNEEYHE